MSKNINDGGPAFARPTVRVVNEFGDEVVYAGHSGMSLRDWFAGMAMQGLLGTRTDPVKGHPELSQQERVAAAAYVIADAMLAAARLDKA